MTRLVAFMESLRNFLDEDDNGIRSFDDEPYIRELQRLTLTMLWKQILVCFYRNQINDLMYNGHRLSSSEVLEASRAIDRLIAEDITDQAKYREAQLIINNGGQL